MDHLSGGIFVVPGADRPDYMSDSLPETIWTLSSCICPLLPGIWQAFVEDRTEAAARDLGTGRDRAGAVVELLDTLERTGRVDRAGLFADLEAARQFRSRLEFLDRSIKLLEIAAPSACLEAALTSAREDWRSDDGNKLLERLERRVDVGKGRRLGYEILGMEPAWGQFHSFLCNSLETNYRKELGIELNEHGKIDSLNDAMRAADYTMRDDVGAEPVDWLPWLVVEHD